MKNEIYIIKDQTGAIHGLVRAPSIAKARKYQQSKFIVTKATADDVYDGTKHAGFEIEDAEPDDYNPSAAELAEDQPDLPTLAGQPQSTEVI